MNEKSAYFIGTLSFCSQNTLNLLIQGGGMQALVNLLDHTNISNCFEVIQVGIDSLMLVIELKLFNL